MNKQSLSSEDGKTVLIAILGTGVVLALILLVSNFNIQININSKEDEASVGQQTAQTTQGAQADSMASHHGGAPTDVTIFNSLVGKSAPDFTLESYDGKKVTLSELKGKNVILFFNEGLMCYPACWNQIAAFGKDSRFKGKDAIVFNIVLDKQEDWKQAIAKMPELTSATVLFDKGGAVSVAYGVLSLPSSMHRGQFPGHTYVIVDKGGIVRFAQDDVQMGIRNDNLVTQMANL